MGMAASQARLLSITARLTNNENSGQSISYAKQRLADQTQQVTNEYNEALDATKLTVLTGFNGAEANYTDISYNLMTGLQMAENTKQYVVTDTKGKVLVEENIAKAYERSRGNFNAFLAQLGNATTNTKPYSQADISVQITDRKYYKYNSEGKLETTTANDPEAFQDSKTLAVEQQIHKAWDKYFETVGINFGESEHDFGFAWVETYAMNNNGQYINEAGEIISFPENATDAQKQEILDQQGVSGIGNGYAGYKKPKTDADGNIIYTEVDRKDQYGNEIKDEKGEILKEKQVVYEKDANGNDIIMPINYEGTTQESRDLYDYASALTEAYLRVNDPNNGTAQNRVSFKTEYKPNNYNTAADSNNTAALSYYKNIFNKMQSSGYFTYTSKAIDVNRDPEHYIFADAGTTGTAGNVQKSPLKDNITFEKALRDGSLRLEYYSTTDKKFKSTTISEDNCIQEVADERAIARAESKYTQDLADLENKDNKLDLELKKLDTEHNALQTEYESVKSVVDKNIESSFKMFS